MDAGVEVFDDDKTPLAEEAEAEAAAAFFAAFLLDFVTAAAFFPAGPTSWKSPPSSSSTIGG